MGGKLRKQVDIGWRYLAMNYLWTGSLFKAWTHKMEDHIAERQLLCAVIEQAYRDATGQGCGKTLMMDAQEWLKSEGKSLFSYIWICEQLQLDPSIIRRAVSSKPEKTLQVNRSEEKFIPAADWQIWKDGFLGLYHIKTSINLLQRHAPYRRRPITRPAKRL